MAIKEYVPGGKIACIHLIYPDANGKIPTSVERVLGVDTPGGMHAIACSPGDAVTPKHFSQEATAVNCPLCRETETFKRIELEQVGGMSNADQKAHHYAMKKKLAEKAARDIAMSATDSMVGDEREIAIENKKAIAAATLTVG